MSRRSETPSTSGPKPCRHCREPIHAAARVCPRCLRGQALFGMLFVSDGQQQLVALAVVLPLVAFLFLFMSRLLRPGKPFAPNAASLEVVASRLNAGTDEGKPFVSVVGTLRNTGDVAWRSLVVEVQLLDANGELVDAITTTPRDVVVQPHGEAAFRVRGAPDRPASDYASHRVVVRDAVEVTELTRDWRDP